MISCKGCSTELELPPQCSNASDDAIVLTCENCGDVTWRCQHCTYAFHLKSIKLITQHGRSAGLYYQTHLAKCCGRPNRRKYLVQENNDGNGNIKRVKLNALENNNDNDHKHGKEASDEANAGDNEADQNEIEFDSSNEEVHFGDHNNNEEAYNDEEAHQNFDLNEEAHVDDTDTNEEADDNDSQDSSNGWNVPNDDNLHPEDLLASQLCETVEILNEEWRTLDNLAEEFTGVDMNPNDVQLNEAICADLASLSFLDLRTDEQKKLRKNSVINSISQNQLYFAQKADVKKHMNGSDLGGFRGLVFRACVRDREHLSGLVSCLEAEVSLMYTLLTMRLGGKDLHRFLMYDTKKSKLTGQLNTDTRLQFPTTFAEIRNFVIDGRYSILKNFPAPAVFVIDNHACVSLKETFLLAAAHRGRFQFAWDGWTRTANKDGLNATEATAKLVHEICERLRKKGMTEEQIAKVNIGSFFFWSDSFLVSFIKQKDNSVWIMTVTISAPLDKINTGKYTFVLAMGRSNNDHTKVIEHYRKEARELMDGFEVYFACRNEIKVTALGLLFHSGDRPERQVVLGNRKEGRDGKCTGYAVCINTKTFPACRDCYKDIMKRILDESLPMHQRKCPKCLCWTIDPEHNPEHYGRASPDYPTVRLKCKDAREPKGREVGLSHLGPVKLTALFMRLACHYAYKARLCGIWTVPNVKEYLRSCNINQHWIDKIVERVEHDKKHKIESSVYEVVPKIWLGETDYEDPFKHFNFPDLPLHALAHGIIPDVMDAIHQILANWRKFTDYVNIANQIIHDIADMRLDWCKIKSLPKAAWVGENTMAYMRLMAYLYGGYFENNKFPQEKESTINNIMRLVHALQATMSLLMSMDKPKPGQVKLFLMMLLSAAHYLHCGYGSLSKGVEGLDGKATTDKCKEFIDGICLNDIMELVNKLGVGNKTDNEAQFRRKLHNVSKERLAQTLKDMGEKVADNTPKLTLQQKLFSKILKRSLNFRTEQSKANTETWFWFKGGWISLVTNLDKQIQYLGVLQLIWYVYKFVFHWVVVLNQCLAYTDECRV